MRRKSKSKFKRNAVESDNEFVFESNQVYTSSVMDDAEVDSDDIEKLEDVVDNKHTKSSVNFINNPLPLPKTHVKKVMNFDHVIAEDMMEFDIKDLKPGDDFDIK